MRALWLLLVIACFSRVAAAHEVGLSQGRYARQGGVLEVELVLAQRDAAALSQRLDPDHDGHIDSADLDSARGELERSLLGSITVGEPNGACSPELTHVSITERDGLLVKGRLRCPAGKEPWRVTLGFVAQLSRGHRHAARIGSGPQARDELLYGDAPSMDVALDGAASGQVERPGGAGGFLSLGLEHILGGYDHLVFLVALVLAGGTLRSLLAVITAFTVGHSLSLALATCGVWAPTPSLIEPGIALSIGYVALENLRGLDPSQRWRVTFPFGLLHGFGFSGALLDVGLSRAEIPSALFFFNVGVELGQVGLLAVALPLVHCLRGWAGLPRFVWPALNVSVAALSVIWFVQRVLV